MAYVLDAKVFSKLFDEAADLKSESASENGITEKNRLLNVAFDVLRAKNGAEVQHIPMVDLVDCLSEIQHFQKFFNDSNMAGPMLYKINLKFDGLKSRRKRRVL